MVIYSSFTSPCTKGSNFSFCCSVTSASISRSGPRVSALAITSSNRTCQMASVCSRKMGIWNWHTLSRHFASKSGSFSTRYLWTPALTNFGFCWAKAEMARMCRMYQPLPPVSTKSGNSSCSSGKQVVNFPSQPFRSSPSSGMLTQAQSARLARSTFSYGSPSWNRKCRAKMVNTRSNRGNLGWLPP